MITKTEHTAVGELDKRVTFQFYGSTDDGMGGVTPDASPTDVLTTWASIRPLSGNELLSQGALQANITHRIRVRHRSDLLSKGYTSNEYNHLLQAEYESRIFNIKYALNQGEDDWYVEMLAVEEAGDEN